MRLASLSVGALSVLCVTGAHAQSSDPCAATPGCHELGLCTYAHGQCVVGPDADCVQAMVCQSYGLCTAWYGRCVPAPILEIPPDRCDEECTEKGRCNWDAEEEECTATTDMMCAASRICVEAGRCSMDGDGGCDDGLERTSTATFAVGLTVVGLGGAGVIGGLLALLTGAAGGVMGGTADQDVMMAGGIAMGVGAGVALLIGLPLALYGGAKVPRDSAKIVVTPSGARLELRF